MSTRNSDRWVCPKHGDSTRKGTRTGVCGCNDACYVKGDAILRARRMAGNAERPGVKTALWRKRKRGEA